MDDNMERLTDIFRDIFDDETLTITPETNLEDIEGWDSLVHISLMTAIQDEFEIVYTIDEITEMETVSKILASIENKKQ